jgi:hypothetical protein
MQRFCHAGGKVRPRMPGAVACCYGRACPLALHPKQHGRAARRGHDRGRQANAREEMRPPDAAHSPSFIEQPNHANCRPLPGSRAARCHMGILGRLRALKWSMSRVPMLVNDRPSSTIHERDTWAIRARLSSDDVRPGERRASERLVTGMTCPTLVPAKGVLAHLPAPWEASQDSAGDPLGTRDRAGLTRSCPGDKTARDCRSSRMGDSRCLRRPTSASLGFVRWTTSMGRVPRRRQSSLSDDRHGRGCVFDLRGKCAEDGLARLDQIR